MFKLLTNDEIYQVTERADKLIKEILPKPKKPKKISNKVLDDKDQEEKVKREV